MKKIIFSLTLLLVIINANSGAVSDSDSSGRSIIKLEVCFGGIQFEHRVGSTNSSIQLSAGYDYHDFGDPRSYDIQFVSEYRFYPSKKGEWPIGFYLGSYCFFKDFIVARDMESNSRLYYSRDRVRTAGIGLDAGYQMKLGRTNRFPVDITFGLGYNLFKDADHLEGVPIIAESSYFLNFLGQITFGYLF